MQTTLEAWREKGLKKAARVASRRAAALFYSHALPLDDIAANRRDAACRFSNWRG